MRYEPGMLALCIDPLLPTRQVTLIEPWEADDMPAWMVRFPSAVWWACLNADGSPGEDGAQYGEDGIVLQRYLIPLRPDADPVETETEREVTA